MADDEREPQVSQYRVKLAARQKAHRTWASFLESTPPNTSTLIPGLAANRSLTTRGPEWKIHLPQLELHCDEDGGTRLFDPMFPALEGVEVGECRFLYYTCRNCGRFVKTYALKLVPKKTSNEFDDVEVYKLGEFLPFGAPISKRIEKLLDKDGLELYRRGLRSEAQGLGIGAATYFRRIVDGQWKLLVKEIREVAVALGEKDLAIYDAALAETQFATAVKMLKDAIPAKLLILDNQNPLTLLYQPLSVGLHNLSDEACLQQAADIRTVLAALLENIGEVLKSTAELKAAAARLTQPKP